MLNYKKAKTLTGVNTQYEKLNGEKGITLIALVITIIVLLIIAAISISLATEGGIIDQAITAEQEVIIAEEKEKILLSYQAGELENQLEGTKIDKDNFKEHLNTYLENESDAIVEELETVEESEKDKILVDRDVEAKKKYLKITYSETGNYYYVAIIDGILYNVTYDSNGGTGEPEIETAYEGETYTISSIMPTKQGQEFLGWEYNGNTYNGNDTVKVTENITFVAKWQIQDYTLTYNTNGGTPVPASVTVQSDQAINISNEVITKDGYTFAGWSEQNDGSAEHQAGKLYQLTGDTTLYAIWDAIEYIITYNANGGTNEPASGTKLGDAIYVITSEEPTKTGHEFKGWTITRNSSQIDYVAGNEYTNLSDLELYAVWEELTYTISYDANGGENAPANQTKKGSETLTLSSQLPTRTAYIFKGWSEQNDNTVEYQAGAEFTKNENITLYAVWEEGIYLVDGTTYASTLEEALEIAVEGSTIELLRDVTDASTDIVVDKTINLELGTNTLTTDKTIKIETTGNLIITSEEQGEEEGTINNTAGVAIENKGTLQLGEDDGTIKSFSPRISGLTTGIVTTGTFKMYDGEVEGDTAIEGESIETPDNRYAMATVNGEREVVRLQQLGDAVARIGYSYYSTIQEAVETIETGTQVDQEKKITTVPTLKNGDYGFNYENNTLVSEPITELDKSANGYIEIDLTEYASDEEYTLTVNVTSPYSYYNYKSIHLTNDTQKLNYYNSTNRLWYSDSNTTNYNVTKALKGGEVYYLHFSYTKVRENNVDNEGLTINSVKINDNVMDLNQEDIITEIVQKNVVPEKQKTITLVTNVSTVTQSQVSIGNRNVAIDLVGKQLDLNQTLLNEGKLEILDSSIDGNGAIQFTNTGTSTNYTEGILNKGDLIISGDIKSSSGYINLIQNEEFSEIELKSGATLNATNSYTYGIVSYGKSSIKVVEDNVNINISGGDGIQSRGKSNIDITKVNIEAKDSEIANIGMASGKIYDIKIERIYNARNSNIELSGSNIINDIANVNQTTVSILGELTTSKEILNSNNSTINIIGNITLGGNMLNTDNAIMNISGNVYSNRRISNYGNAILNILNGTVITTSTDAIYSYNNAKVNIENGIIQGSSNGIFIYGNSELVLGIKDGSVSTEIPQIIGTNNYGIHNYENSKIYFYDGIVKGKTASIYGAVTEVEENNEVIKEVGGDGNKIAYVGRREVAQIGDTKFYSLKEAIDSIEENNLELVTIQMISAHSNMNEINTGNRKIILDLNGKTIESNNTILNSGELQIIDTSTTRTGGIEFNKSGVDNNNLFIGIKNIGILEFASKIKINGSYSAVIYNTNSGTVEMLSGEITVYGSDSHGVYNESVGIIKVLGGTITSGYNQYSSNYAVSNVGTGKVEITAGTTNVTGIYAKGIHNSSTGEIKINGGTHNSAVYNTGDGIIEILEGVINHLVNNERNGKINILDGEMNYSIDNSAGGIINISGGNINSNVDNNSSGTINITGGNINSNVYNYNTGTINITGGNITATTSYSMHGVINQNTGTINITGGNITATTTSTSSNYISYGVYNVNTGTITIGSKNAEGETGVSVENPNIQGTTHGLHNVNGTVNFYDGIVKGQIESIVGAVNNIEEGYSIVKDELDGYKRAYLGQVDVAQIGSTNYTSIESAIASIEEGNIEVQTIKIINEIVDVKEEDLIFGNRKILIDLNGYKISLVRTITNSGELQIIDSSIDKTGEIEFNKSGVDTNNLFIGIKNTGDLEIATKLELNGSYGAVIENQENGNTKVLENSYIAISGSSDNYGICNAGTGTVEMINGEITVYGRDSHGIYNESTGVIRVLGGTITSGYNQYSSNYAVSNVGTGKVEITAGTTNVTGRYAKGIHNSSTGEIKINGGTHNSAVYNTGDGIIEILEGVINHLVNNERNGKINILDGEMNYSIDNSAGGIINISGGNINSNVDNNSSGTINITGGNINSNVYNYNTGTINITGGNITATTSYTTHGVINQNTGTINITGGNITATTTSTSSNYISYGVYNVNTGTITIGSKNAEGETGVSVENPNIQGTTHGLHNVNGTVNFYDGIVKGQIESIVGAVNNIEDGYSIIKDEVDGYERAYLGQVDVAQIGSTNYTSIESAIASIEEGNIEVQTIKIINEIIDVKVEDLIFGNRNIILDLNGYKISLLRTVINSGELQIIDSSIDKTGEIEFNKSGVDTNNLFIGIKNTRELEIASKIELNGSYGVVIENQENGTMKVLENSYIAISGSSDNYGICNAGTGTVEMINGEITVYGRDGHGICNESTGVIRILGGTITSGYNQYSTNYAVSNLGAGKIELIEGITNVTGGYAKGIYNSSIGEIKINGGTHNSAVYNYGDGIIEILEGVMNYRIYNEKNGIINILDGEINNQVNNSAGGIINISGGKINSSVSNNSTGTINISGGEIIIETSSSSEYGVTNSKTGTINITGGEISVTTTSTSSSKLVYGVNNVSTGTITIGEQGGEISKTVPSIIGTTHGVSNNGGGTLNFYDGVIKGKTNTYYGTITDIEPDYQLSETIVGEYEEGTLIPVGGEVIIASINGVNYGSLQDAIALSSSGDTIVLRKDVILENSSIEVLEDREITISLNGYSITGNGEVVLINSGDLTIIGSSGKIENTVGMAIKNTGKVTLGEDDGNVSIDSPSIIGGSVGIENTGEFIFYDGIVKGTVSLDGLVTNKPLLYTTTIVEEDSKEKMTLVSE